MILIISIIISLLFGAPAFRSHGNRSQTDARAELNVALQIIKRLGLEADVDRSGLSTSRYVTIYGSEDADGDREQLGSIRIANHEQRPSYYQPHDIEVGDHADSDFLTARSRAFAQAVAELAGKKFSEEDLESMEAAYRSRSKAASRAAAAAWENRLTAYDESAARIADAIRQTGGKWSDASIKRFIEEHPGLVSDRAKRKIGWKSREMNKTDIRGIADQVEDQLARDPSGLSFSPKLLEWMADRDGASATIQEAGSSAKASRLEKEQRAYQRSVEKYKAEQEQNRIKAEEDERIHQERKERIDYLQSNFPEDVALLIAVQDGRSHYSTYLGKHVTHPFNNSTLKRHFPPAHIKRLLNEGLIQRISRPSDRIILTDKGLAALDAANAPVRLDREPESPRLVRVPRATPESPQRTQRTPRIARSPLR